MAFHDKQLPTDAQVLPTLGPPGSGGNHLAAMALKLEEGSPSSCLRSLEVWAALVRQ